VASRIASENGLGVSQRDHDLVGPSEGSSDGLDAVFLRKTVCKTRFG
jgi:hypothetical protein